MKGSARPLLDDFDSADPNFGREEPFFRPTSDSNSNAYFDRKRQSTQDFNVDNLRVSLAPSVDNRHLSIPEEAVRLRKTSSDSVQNRGHSLISANHPHVALEKSEIRSRKWNHRMVNSRAYLILYIIILGLTGFLLIYEINHHDKLVHRGEHKHNVYDLPLWFKILDMTVLVILVLEVFIRMLSYRPVCDFFKKHWFNVFDFAVVALCLAVQIIELSLPNKMRNNAWLDTLLIILRYAARFLVMCFLFAHNRQHRKRMKAVGEPIIFDEGIANESAKSREYRSPENLGVFLIDEEDSSRDLVDHRASDFQAG